MSVITTNNPDTPNFLGQTNYRADIKRAKNVNYFCRSVNIPGISLPPADDSSPFVNIPWSGDHVTFEHLNIEFNIDENFNNFLEIHNWIRATGYTDDLSQYKALKDKPSWSNESIKSEIIVTIMNSSRIPNLEIVFHDCIPTNLSGITFTSATNATEFLAATASFAYTTYDITRII